MMGRQQTVLLALVRHDSVIMSTGARRHLRHGRDEIGRTTSAWSRQRLTPHRRDLDTGRYLPRLSVRLPSFLTSAGPVAQPQADLSTACPKNFWYPLDYSARIRQRRFPKACSSSHSSAISARSCST